MLVIMTRWSRDDIGRVQRRLLRIAGEDLPRYEFFSKFLEEVIEITGCSTACLVLGDHEKLTSWEANRTSRARLRITSLPEDSGTNDKGLREGYLAELCVAVLHGSIPKDRGTRTDEGAFFDESWPIPGKPHGRFASSPVAVLPLSYTGEDHSAVLGLRMLESVPFEPKYIAGLTELAEAVAVGVTHHLLQWALRERVKELTCLYGTTRIAQSGDIPEETALQHIVDLLPSGWQYPEITSASVTIDGKTVAASGTVEAEAEQRQAADLRVGGLVRGSIEVAYSEERPLFDEGPFLREERRLLEQVAGQIASMLEGRQAARERAELQKQFREAERLATIGRLAAGTAHELNEPLGAILGFAQLACKQPKLPKAVKQDLDSIVKASLHAREVIKKMLLFSRQAPPRKAPVSVNPIIEDALLLVRGRLDDRRIEVRQRLCRTLPKVRADPAQIQQVLINLIVNAVQAMPNGGTLGLQTRKAGAKIEMSVSDSGVGMSEDVVEQAFMPFFTTKDVGRGTGLGLSVVHGIVTSHGGTVQVDSSPGEGTTVTIALPSHTPRRSKKTPRTRGVDGP